jgi:hypothetical protein
MTTLPPWAALRNKSTGPIRTETQARDGWQEPPLLLLDKHLRFYRDLLRSTEKVELSLAHSGKAEIFESLDDPRDPQQTVGASESTFPTIQVPIRFGVDPRSAFLREDGSLSGRPEYYDIKFLSAIFEKRERASVTPLQSNGSTPQPSPQSSAMSAPLIPEGRLFQAPPGPPPGAPPVYRPPPPKAPPPLRPDDITKRQRTTLQ